MPDTKQNQPYYTLTSGQSPLIATAIHDGHTVRDNISSFFLLTSDERLREEDPFTAGWVGITDNQVIGLNSRFEMDLNRAREKAIYRKPEDAWGLTVWKDELPEEMAQESLARYDQFYANVKKMLQSIVDRHGCFVV